MSSSSSDCVSKKACLADAQCMAKFLNSILSTWKRHCHHCVEGWNDQKLKITLDDGKFNVSLAQYADIDSAMWLQMKVNLT